jgi:LAO/AO transport system kinase
MISDANGLLEGLLAGDRRALSKAITLLESQNPLHRPLARELLEGMLPFSGRSKRIGISGIPGVGKSTLIEALGMLLLEGDLGGSVSQAPQNIAILAVDPSSSRTGGSILGDKTRMQQLANHPRVYVRPSPAAGSLGGVARRTLECILACEAAGFDLIIIETVGVGQSETTVAQMSDLFMLLTLPHAGDELQGIKRGIMELADVVVVHKADLDFTATQRATAELTSALSLLTPHEAAWRPKVLQVSSKMGTGLLELWQAFLQYLELLGPAGLQHKRQSQQRFWFENLLREHLWERFALERGTLLQLQAARVEAGEVSAFLAVEELL